MTASGGEPEARPVRIGNVSGFCGDRASAMREMLTGGPLDVVTGDYLAELTMLVLGRERQARPEGGYVPGFVQQLEECLGLALDQGVRIVANAGGLNPAGLAEALRALAARLGLDARIAHVEGDDLLPRAAELGLDRGPYGMPFTANAYLGAWGIATCLHAGADVVVTGRVTDASLVAGPAAAHFGWSRTDYDALAGATIAGHLIENGCQVTGGNYAFFGDLVDAGADLRHPGFPLAEVYPDGSAVITKHEDTGGAVTVGIVTAQLLRDLGGHRYPGPDVTARLDAVQVSDAGPDRVRVSGVRGQPPPSALKVCLNHQGGFRNEVAFALTGLDIDAKAILTWSQLETALSARRPAEVSWSLARTDRADAAVEAEASALLRCTVRDKDADVVGRAFTGAAAELALAGYPGFHLTTPLAAASPYGVFEAAYVDAGQVEHVAVLPDGVRVPVASADPATAAPVEAAKVPLPLPLPVGPTVRVPLGRVVGASCGEKGGAANIGLWVDDDDAWRWLARTITVREFRRLLPETAALPVARHVFPTLRALNFVVEGLLAEPRSATRLDPRGRALGELLRSRFADVPRMLLTSPRASASGIPVGVLPGFGAPG